MIVNPENWHYGYSQIQTDCRANDDGVAGSVLILSNADADAMCGARILSYMLRSDGISYHLLPCMSYSYMQKVLARKKADDVRAVVLLNIGASRNLTRLFDAVNTEEDQEESLLDPSTKIYVMDCRRPVHLANIHAGENVVVFWDGPAQNEDIPSDGDNLSGDDSSSSSEEEGDDDDSSSDGEEEFDEDLDEEGEENEFGGDGAQNHMQVDIEDDQNISKKDEHESDYDADKDEDDGDNGSKMMVGDDINGDDRSKDGSDNDVNENGDDSGSQQQQEEDHEQNQLPTLTPREMHNERRNRLRAYYSSGSFHGSPAAYVAYKVSTQLRFNEIGDLLWLACVGVTDAYLHSRLDVSGYAELAMFLRLRATSLFPNDMYHRVENTAYAEHLTGVGSDRRSNSQNLTKIGFSENGRILSESDYRFFLLRHTTLYKAMICSDFVSTRLQLHTKRGRERLQEFLAKIGMSLEECNQPFAFMKPGLIRRLPKQMREHAEEYNLQNFEYTGFFRVTGFRSLLSAADTSSAVTALLECDRPREISTTDESGIDDDREEAELLQSFNYAYDALNPNESGEGNSQGNLVNGGNLTGGTGLGAGIKLAMVVQENIINTATSLIERSAITRLDHFRYAYLTCSSQGDKEGGATHEGISSGESTAEEEKQHIFAKPLALTRLAHYLIDLHRANGKWTGANANPNVLVLLAEKPRTKTYLVMAYEYAEEAGHFIKNKFGKNFELAAQSMQGTFRFDSFDTNIVEVGSKDVQRFIEQLHYLMSSM